VKSALTEAIAILNGTLGDYLARTRNGLATEMELHGDLPAAKTAPRVAVFLHGVMNTESVWQFDDGSDYGTRLARDFGFLPLYVRYNTGRAIDESGADLARVLATFVATRALPPEEILLVGYSMGGLVVRSACQLAEKSSLPWLTRVRRCIYVGTPHTGAPAERVGRVVARVLGGIPDPYTKLVRDVGDLRSRGIKDLGDGARGLPLHPGIEHCLIAGALSDRDALDPLGDAMVPVGSATNAHDGAAARVRVIRGLNHVQLAHDERVYSEMKLFLERESS
jgi:pimeloyl-ACP methyl ester carboxylesterase